MGSLWRRLPPALIILVLGAALMAALITLRPRPEPRPEPEPPPPVVDVTRVVLEDRALTVRSQGTVEPRREIQLVSQVGGTVVDVAPNYASGGTFAAGEWLVQIDERDYRFALAGAQARLADAQQALAAERGLSRQAQREWRDLGSEDANALFLRKPQLAAAEATVAAAQADLERAQLDLERARVSAPFRGRIRDTLVNLGQYVAPGTPIATIYDASVAEVHLALTDGEAALLDLPLGFDRDEEVFPEVVLSGEIAGERYQWQGRITRTQASLDAQSRMFHAIVEIPEPFNRERQPAPLLMGLFVEAEISGRSIPGLAALPRSAVFQRNQIYTVSDEGEVTPKQVRIVRVEADRVWVKGDLRDQEAVITDRQGYLRPGVQVAIAGEQDEAGEDEQLAATSAGADE
ncbi:efflux RND transporter periplasmic adaptor subunit [Marinimicrobium sp. ABcell2]|uniref:efflux RND transporter periplasmic adaptor subunit n=1 Tax=Marinimicrobium sp. ABcell2 TaxID=3069751 RepID=UPI0027B26775|nr:efflux RND transporter periplasmic adaptor subunit [Marinimicrobium sp. ABcell2]MDQ2076820.1 efflux RND transporter periplasmic adaptor subunit [Marinimicrobium sp. ABcell2]